jgi:hypothetical protein
MTYVIYTFAINSRESYMMHMVGAHAARTYDVSLAMPFRSARAAYEFGARNGLLAWKVGKR